jgi:hypothetical protein
VALHFVLSTNGVNTPHLVQAMSVYAATETYTGGRGMSQKNPQAQTNYIQTNRDSTSNQAKSNYYLSLGRNASLLLGGAIAGVAFTATVWWVKPVGVAGDNSTYVL